MNTYTHTHIITAKSCIMYGEPHLIFIRINNKIKNNNNKLKSFLDFKNRMNLKFICIKCVLYDILWFVILCLKIIFKKTYYFTPCENNFASSMSNISANNSNDLKNKLI